MNVPNVKQLFTKRTTKTMGQNKTDTVGVRFAEGEKEELENIAEILDVPLAQIVREAVREKVEKLQKHPKIRKQAEVAV